MAIIVLTVGLGLSYGRMSAMYAEMFPVSVRCSGVAIGYALGAILGGTTPGRPPSRYEASVARARAPGSTLTAGGACVSPGHA